MSKHTYGYYVIQYIPILSRWEGVNVGLVMTDPCETGKVLVRMAEADDRVRAITGPKFDEGRYAIWALGFTHRLSEVDPDGGVEEFARKEGNMFRVLVDPGGCPQIMFSDLPLEAEFEQMFRQLVSWPPPEWSE